MKDTICYKDLSEKVHFKTKKQLLKRQKNRKLGFSAQKIQKVFPELVSTDKNDYLNVDYIGLIPVVVEALKEQQVQIKKQQIQIEEQK